MTDKYLSLNNGTKIPALGLGTWRSVPPECKNAVTHALKSGYKHIDCAWMYDNEEEVGEGLKAAFAAGIKREDIFVTTKLWCTFHSRAEENLDMSLKSLGLDYVDLYLMHWPLPMNPKGNPPKAPRFPDGSRDLDTSWSHIKTWKLMEKLLSTGKVKAIGVCNYSVKYLEDLLAEATVVPAVNQIENHPYLPQQDVLDFCKSRGIVVTAYSPFGSDGSPLFKEEGIIDAAKKHDVSVGTILISYQIARGISVIPKSIKSSRIEENMKVIDLGSSDLAALESISQTKGVKRYVLPDFGVDFGFPDQPLPVR